METSGVGSGILSLWRNSICFSKEAGEDDVPKPTHVYSLLSIFFFELTEVIDFHFRRCG